MYDIRVIRGNKKSLVNYINAIHVFSKNIRGQLLKFMSKIIYIYIYKIKKYKREGGFLESQRGHGPPSPHPAALSPLVSSQNLGGLLLKFMF